MKIISAELINEDTAMVAYRSWWWTYHAIYRCEVDWTTDTVWWETDDTRMPFITDERMDTLITPAP